MLDLQPFGRRLIRMVQTFGDDTLEVHPDRRLKELRLPMVLYLADDTLALEEFAGRSFRFWYGRSHTGPDRSATAGRNPLTAALHAGTSARRSRPWRSP